MDPSSLVPEPSGLSLAPLFEGSSMVCLGAAAIFLIVVVLYFLLRGKKR